MIHAESVKQWEAETESYRALISQLRAEVARLKRDHIGAHRVSIDTIRLLEAGVERGSAENALLRAKSNDYHNQIVELRAEVERLKADVDCLKVELKQMAAKLMALGEQGKG
jgi:uncharacterized coiled-coil DUF342 family protein